MDVLDLPSTSFVCSNAAAPKGYSHRLFDVHSIIHYLLQTQTKLLNGDVSTHESYPTEPLGACENGRHIHMIGGFSPHCPHLDLILCRFKSLQTCASQLGGPT